MTTMFLLTAGAMVEVFEDAVVPIFICVILPCFIVWVSINGKKHELDKKTELALKAIENGAEVDPNFFSNIKSSTEGFKEKVFSYMKKGIILSSIGILFLLMGFIMRKMIQDAIVGFYSTAAIFIVLGNAFFLIYLIAKKKFSAEIAKEEAEAQRTEQQ